MSAVVILNPQLLATPCRTVAQLRLLNSFCRLKLAELCLGLGLMLSFICKHFLR